MAYTGVDLTNRLFFIKLIFRWTGSVWQLLWVDLIAFTLLYIFINLLYRFGLRPNQKDDFENFVRYVQKLGTLTSLSFLLGFYVSTVIGRWWSVCMSIPWMNAPAFMTMSLMGKMRDSQLSRNLRLTIMRYMNLAWILGMKAINLQIYHRFQLPEEEQSMIQNSLAFKIAKKVGRNVTTLVTEGKLHRKDKDKSKIKRRLEKINDDPIIKKHFGYLLTEEEIESFVQIADRTSNSSDYQGEYWIPLQWCVRLLNKTKEYIFATEQFSVDLVATNNRQYTMMVKMLNSFRNSLATLTIFNDITIPLVYTQVVVIAVYAFFLAEIFTAQQLKEDGGIRNQEIEMIASKAPNGESPVFSYNKLISTGSFDHYIPIFSIFKFILFMGWFKTAICLMNPFGDDSHSIPTLDILEENLKMSYKCVSSEDFLFPTYLHEDGDAAMQLSTLMSTSAWKASLEDLEEIVDDPSPAKPLMKNACVSRV